MYYRIKATTLSINMALYYGPKTSDVPGEVVTVSFIPPDGDTTDQVFPEASSDVRIIFVTPGGALVIQGGGVFSPVHDG